MQMAERQNEELDAMLQRIAENRDKLLGAVESISPTRFATFRELLEKRLPLEAAVHVTSTKRDQLLDKHQVKISPRIMKALQHHLSAAGGSCAARGSAWFIGCRKYAIDCSRFFRISAHAVVVMSCIIATTAVICFGYREFPKGHATHIIVEGTLTGSGLQKAPSAEGVTYRNTARSGEPSKPQIGRARLNLAVSASELATLRASFFATNRVSFDAEGNEHMRMRLDLPVRALLSTNKVAKSP
ncbi:MAG: hypothetical protein H0X34_16860 [Chthoniobacterales bacterium]|nr:hypothetical protein [Chthoniobacterales bacterium]